MIHQSDCPAATLSGVEAGFAAGDIARIHAPIGLDIGADNPEEIAISIVAELVACRRRCEAALARRRLRPEEEAIRPPKLA